MQFRFVIVGAGVYGCATAWHLARRGADVVVLEADEIASGASGGLGRRGVRANRRAGAELPLMAMAYPIWQRLADDLGADLGYERFGGLNLVEQEVTGTRGGLVSLEAVAWRQRALGIPTEVLDRAHLKEYEPDVTDAMQGALWCPLDGAADHTATTRAFAAAARQAGAVIREHTRVRELVRSGNEVTAVVVEDGDRIEVGEAVLLLNNAGVGELVAGFGDQLPVWHLFPQVLTARADVQPCRHLVGHDHRVLSMKPHGDEVMISGGWRGRWNPDTGRGEPIQEHVDRNLAEARSVYPALAKATVGEVDVSRAESCCVDEIPVIDALPSVRNVVVGTGWSGHGFAIAPAVASLLADWLTEQVKPSALVPFRYGRFGSP
ncbi:MAG: FAD-dependent oxidoreductase [Streptosporangiales bacterium]|nr:FAD-dependent oxidoreductase [Streptosporangiales bacterium]